MNRKDFELSSIVDIVVDCCKSAVYSDTAIKKEVEKELSLWDSIKIKFGGLAFIIVATSIIYLTWFIKRKDRQNI